jgi:hypothetical protein
MYSLFFHKRTCTVCLNEVSTFGFEITYSPFLILYQYIYSFHLMKLCQLTKVICFKKIEKMNQIKFIVEIIDCVALNIEITSRKKKTKIK